MSDADIMPGDLMVVRVDGAERLGRATQRGVGIMGFCLWRPSIGGFGTDRYVLPALRRATDEDVARLTGAAS